MLELQFCNSSPYDDAQIKNCQIQSAKHQSYWLMEGLLNYIKQHLATVLRLHLSDHTSAVARGYEVHDGAENVVFNQYRRSDGMYPNITDMNSR